MMSFSAWLFYGFSGILLASAAAVVLARHPVHAALSLVLSFVSMAALWISLGAEFLGLALIVIYVGAVMVFFLFVMMMLDLRHLEEVSRWRAHHVPMFLVGILFFVEIAALITHGVPSSISDVTIAARNTNVLAQFLYSHYLFSLLLIGVLLLAAMLSAIALVYRKNTLAKRQDVAAQVAVTKASRAHIIKMPSERDDPINRDETAGEWH